MAFEAEINRRVRNLVEALAIEKGVTPDALMASATSALAAARLAGCSRPLSEIERAQVESIRELGSMMIDLLHEIGGTDRDGDRLGSRDLALAATHIEDGVSRAVQHIIA